MESPRVRSLAMVLAGLGLFAAPSQCQPGAGAASVVLGPARDVANVVRFGTDPPGAWAGACGQNVKFTLTPQKHVPGIPDPVLGALVDRKRMGDPDATHNWFSLSRKGLPVPALPADFDGFRFVLASATEAKWWIMATFTTDSGESFSHLVADNSFPARQPVEWLIPLDKFESAKHEPLTLEKARTIRAISFATSSPNTTLLFDRITAYRRARLHGWLDFTTSHPTNNLFQRTDPVGFAFTLGGARPADATGFRCEVRDYYGKTVDREQAPLTDASRYGFPPSRRAPGYFEVRAYWTNAAGKDLEPYSCIRGEGTVPQGLGTFAVLPHTIAENQDRSRRLGEKAFFGLHGDFLGLADYVGLTWRFDYTFWPDEEPTRPDRSSGTAPWAEAILKGPPEAGYRVHIRPFTLNLSVPKWARADGWPGFRWDDAMAMVRDTVKVEKRLYPNMRRRIYGGLWEVDLNDPLYGTQKPVYSPAEIAETYRRIRQVVKAEDPAGMVIGPCSSVIRPGWFEQTFKAGVLKYVEGVETHAYPESCLTPEADRLPERIEQLDALVRRYHRGKALPIYVTEAGQPGILGTDVVSRSQAERMVRTCIILKGEGVRVYLPFYGIDYGRSGYWGFLYNLDVDSPSGPWSTRRTSPKPMVNAVAACVDILEGANPVTRLRTLGAGIWAYVFLRGKTRITAVWSPSGKQMVDFPARGTSIEVVDIMGRATRIAARRGVVRLAVGEAPVYLVQ